MNAPTEADVLTAHGFRMLARADEARPAYRLGLVAAALFAFTEADHGHRGIGRTRRDDSGRWNWWESSGSVTALSTS